MNALLTKIFSSPWLLYAENSDVYAARLVSMFKGNSLGTRSQFAKAREENRSYIISSMDQGGEGPTTMPMSSPDIPEGSVMVIPIQGEIMKADQECGTRGVSSINADIIAAQKNPAICSILLVVDSPGGQSSFVDILSNTISSCTKPIVAYVEGTAASAAYWIISGCDQIICSSELDMVGSIGAMLTWMDLKGYLEKEGVVLHEVYATTSTEKNQAIADLRAGNYQPVRENLLDPLNQKFQSTVMANRKKLNPACLTGNIYHAADAIDMGMVDAIGCFDEALELACTIKSKNTPDQLTNAKSEKMNIKMQAVWTSIAALFGFTGDVSANEITPDMITQMNDRMSEQQATIDAKQAEIVRLTQVSEDHIALQSAHAELTRQHDALLAQDAGKETTAGKSADRTPDQLASDQYLHNKVADENM